MEILKVKATTLVICLLLLGNINAQTQKDLQSAFSMSYSLEAEKNYTGAISSLTKVYVKGNYEMNLRLGWLNYLSGNKVNSTKYYRIAIKLMPVATEPLWGILNPYLAKEDWVNVEKTYLSILKLDVKNSSANYRLGTIYYYRKNYSKANKYYNTALNLNPFDYDILLMSAWTKYFLGQFRHAKVLFNKLLLNSPNDISALEGLSMIK